MLTRRHLIWNLKIKILYKLICKKYYHHYWHDFPCLDECIENRKQWFKNVDSNKWMKKDSSSRIHIIENGV